VDDLTRLFVAARDGDRLALCEAIRRAQPEVWRLCAHLVDRESADDLTQDAFVRAYRALPAYRAEASGRTWLLVIARRTCADELRRRTRRRRVEALLTAREGEPDRSGASALEALVAGLSAERREAFVLTQVLGCSYQEAADACDVPVGTIRSRVARARGDLLAALRDAESA